MHHSHAFFASTGGRGRGRDICRCAAVGAGRVRGVHDRDVPKRLLPHPNGDLGPSGCGNGRPRPRHALLGGHGHAPDECLPLPRRWPPRYAVRRVQPQPECPQGVDVPVQHRGITGGAAADPIRPPANDRTDFAESFPADAGLVAVQATPCDVVLAAAAAPSVQINLAGTRTTTAASTDGSEHGFRAPAWLGQWPDRDCIIHDVLLTRQVLADDALLATYGELVQKWNAL